MNFYWNSVGPARKKPLQRSGFFRAPSGARTLDPNIKSVVLYQLS